MLYMVGLRGRYISTIKWLNPNQLVHHWSNSPKTRPVVLLRPIIQGGITPHLSGRLELGETVKHQQKEVSKQKHHPHLHEKKWCHQISPHFFSSFATSPMRSPRIDAAPCAASRRRPFVRWAPSGWRRPKRLPGENRRSLQFFDFIHAPMINNDKYVMIWVLSIFMVYIFVFLYISILEMLNISCYGWNVFDFKLVHMAKLMANFALAGTLTDRQILETSQVDKWSTRRNRFLATRSARFGQCHGLHPSIDPFSAIGLRHGDRCLLGHGLLQLDKETPPVRRFGVATRMNQVELTSKSKR